MLSTDVEKTNCRCSAHRTPTNRTFTDPSRALTIPPFPRRGCSFPSAFSSSTLSRAINSNQVSPWNARDSLRRREHDKVPTVLIRPHRSIVSLHATSPSAFRRHPLRIHHDLRYRLASARLGDLESVPLGAWPSDCSAILEERLHRWFPLVVALRRKWPSPPRKFCYTFCRPNERLRRIVRILVSARSIHL